MRSSARPVIFEVTVLVASGFSVELAPACGLASHVARGGRTGMLAPFAGSEMSLGKFEGQKTDDEESRTLSAPSRMDGERGQGEVSR